MKGTALTSPAYDAREVMPVVSYQEMTPMDCLAVLRAVSVTRAAFTDGVRPYVVPLAFQLDAEGLTPVICLCMPAKGRKADCLRALPRLCLEFESPSCAWVEVVLLEGRAQLTDWAQGEGLIVRVRAEKLSGRRFFLQEDG